VRSTAAAVRYYLTGFSFESKVLGDSHLVDNTMIVYIFHCRCLYGSTVYM
jgi:hypothetical protein